MITNRYLPQWLHRVACGVLGAAVVVAIASGGLRYFDEDSWMHTASGVLLWLSIPIGVVLACLAHRFSIVEGCAGDVGMKIWSQRMTTNRRPNMRCGDRKFRLLLTAK
jgi:hypothetical protein